MAQITLPPRIFMIGAPGSRWSGIAQNLEDGLSLNTTDRTADRNYTHHSFSGHLGVYYGTGWNYDTTLSDDNLDPPFYHTNGTRILKSHEWAYQLDEIVEKYPTDWIMLVHRPDLACQAWWHEAGGFEIKYPDYRPYFKDYINMLHEIQLMNNAMFTFSQKNNLSWNHISGDWIGKQFGKYIEPTIQLPDTLVTIYKGK